MPDNFGETDLDLAISRLGMCEFFPRDAGERAAVKELLVDICPSKTALEWLTKTFRDRIGRWHGPAELRAVLCWRFKPADGIERDSNLPGFRVSDGEAQASGSHAQIQAGGWIASEVERTAALPSASAELNALVRRVAERKPL